MSRSISPILEQEIDLLTKMLAYDAERISNIKKLIFVLLETAKKNIVRESELYEGKLADNEIDKLIESYDIDPYISSAELDTLKKKIINGVKKVDESERAIILDVSLVILLQMLRIKLMDLPHIKATLMSDVVLSDKELDVLIGKLKKIKHDFSTDIKLNDVTLLINTILSKLQTDPSIALKLLKNLQKKLSNLRYETNAEFRALLDARDAASLQSLQDKYPHLLSSTDQSNDPQYNQMVNILLRHEKSDMVEYNDAINVVQNLSEKIGLAYDDINEYIPTFEKEPKFKLELMLAALVSFAEMNEYEYNLRRVGGVSADVTSSAKIFSRWYKEFGNLDYKSDSDILKLFGATRTELFKLLDMNVTIRREVFITTLNTYMQANGKSPEEITAFIQSITGEITPTSPKPPVAKHTFYAKSKKP